MNFLSPASEEGIKPFCLVRHFIDFWQNMMPCFKGKEAHRLRRLIGHQRAIREQLPDELIANAAWADGARLPRNIWAHTYRERVPGTRCIQGFGEPNVFAQ